MIKTLLLFFFGCFLIPFVAAQEDSNPVFLGFKPQYGFIIPHSTTIKDISHTKPYGMELEYGWILKQKKDWLRCNCYSKAGFSLLHVNYNNPGIVGSSSSLIAFAEPMLSFRGDFRTSLRMGVGISYLSKTYHSANNPENLFFSTHINFLVHLDLNLYYQIDPQYLLMGYAKYNHISNGGIKEPNKGMNFPMFGVGLQYAFEPVSYREVKKTKYSGKTLTPSLQFYTTAVNTTNSNDVDSDWLLVYGSVFKTRYRLGKINALNVGLDASFDKSKQKDERPFFQGALLAGHDFIFGKFIFSQYWGTYLYAPSIEKDFYQRYSLLVELYKNFRFGVTLKAHAEVADNFNILFSYEF